MANVAGDGVEVRVATISLSGSQLSVGTPTTVASGTPAPAYPVANQTAAATEPLEGLGYGRPAWRRDETALVLGRGSDVLQVPATGGVPPRVVRTVPGEAFVAVAATDHTRPGSFLLGGAVATTTGVGVTFQKVPADPDWTATYVRRVSNGVTLIRRVPVSYSYSDTAVRPGTNYRYEFAALDSSGNLGPWSGGTTMRTPAR